MKRRSSIIFFSLLLSLSFVLAGCMWHLWKEGDKGFTVRLDPSGKAISVVSSDGKPVKYDPEEEKRILG